MSHHATAWAWGIRGLKPATKIVLLHLADRHNPDFGCFPSIARLARDCEMSERSVHTHLAELEASGLITRSARHRHNGQQSSNEYTLNMGLQNLHPHPAKSAPLPLQNLQTNNLVRDNQVSLTLIDQADDFEAIWSLYPRKVGKGAARKAYAAAIKRSPQERILAALRAYCAAQAGRDQKFIPHLSTWLNQERWDDDIEAPADGIDQSWRAMVSDLARVQR